MGNLKSCCRQPTSTSSQAQEPLTLTLEPLTLTQEPLTLTQEPLTLTQEPLTLTKEPYDTELVYKLLLHHRPRIVQGLNSYVLEFMLPFLSLDEQQVINSETTDSDKYRKLIDTLGQGPGEHLNKFMKCVAGVLPELFKAVAGRDPTTSETGFYVNDTKNELSNLIKEKGHMEDGTDKKIDLNTHHVELAMVSESLVEKLGNMPGTDSQLPDRYEDHTATMKEKTGNISPLTILNNGPESVEGEPQPPTNPQAKILLYGRAGIGKSTLLQWLANQWACLKWASTFSLIFFIQLRSLTTIDHEITAVKLLTVYGLYPLTETGCNIASCMLEYFPGKILVLLDGLDEISKFGDRIKNTPKLRSIHVMASPTEIVFNILRGDLLPKCTIISTSRPFNELLNVNIHNSVYEILGLTQERLQLFVERHHPRNVKRIMASLNDNRMLKSICSITFYGVMVTNLLSEGAIYAADDLMTYTRFTAFTSIEYLSRKYDGNFLLDVKKSFRRLAKMAYNGIFQVDNNMSKIVFNETDCQKCKLSNNNIEFLVKCGIIKTRTKQNSRTFECLHLSVQEFLAAAYLVSTATTPDHILESLFNTGQFDMVLMFVFGFTYDTNYTTIQQIYLAVNPSGEVDESMRCKIETALLNMTATLSDMPYDTVDDYIQRDQTALKLCQIAQETRSASVARQVAAAVVPSDGRLDIAGTHMTMLDLSSLAFVCKFSPPLVRVWLVDVQAGDDFVKLFLTTIFDGHKDTIKRLNLSFNNIGDEGVTAVCEAVRQSHCIEWLDLRCNHFTRVGRQKLGQLKCQKPLLRIDTSEKPLVYIHDGVLDIHKYPMNLAVVTFVFSQPLVTVWLPGVGADDDFVKLFVTTIFDKQKDSIKYLYFSNNIGDKGVASLCKALKHSDCIKDVDLSHNNIGDEGVASLCEELKDCIKYLTINLGSNNYTRVGIQMLAKLKHQKPRLIIDYEGK